MDLTPLLDRIAALPPGRRIVALAGPPGAGKSTLVDGLAAALPSAAILPMDGYHYDDAVLRARGTLARKGAPGTFDADGLAQTLARLKRRDEAEVAVPVFDRDLELSRGAARIIDRAVETVIVEGNWLLLDRPPWTGLAPFFDLTVWLDVPLPELERRLRARWTGYGFDAARMAAKLEGNDLPNAREAAAHSRAADLVLRWEGAAA